MNNAHAPQTLLDFWKIPNQVLSCDDHSLPGQVKISMPAPTALGHTQRRVWGAPHEDAPNQKTNQSATIDPEVQTISLAFNLTQNVHDLLHEEYMKRESDHVILNVLRNFYYLFKPLIPRNIQIALRRRSVEKFKQRSFPAWPVDLTVDLIHYQVLQQVLELQQPHSLPMIAFWPDGAQYSCVLTHDVEQINGLNNIDRIVDLERRYGFRSAWNFVPERYPVNMAVLQRLQADGFEVGVHGLLHDGRLFENYKTFRERAFRINQYAKKWGSVGFRSPSNLRDLNWISRDLEFEYDTSCLSSERYGAQPGGSCTVFPFIFEGMVELPITLQQDFTLMEILKLPPEQAVDHWIETIKTIRKQHGMVLINIHPDYITGPEHFAAYEMLLQFLSNETDCWHALPKEAAQWWRDRHASALSSDGQNWCIQGPAAERGQVVTVSLIGGEIQMGLLSKA